MFQLLSEPQMNAKTRAALEDVVFNSGYEKSDEIVEKELLSTGINNILDESTNFIFIHGKEASEEKFTEEFIENTKGLPIGLCFW